MKNNTSTVFRLFFVLTVFFLVAYTQTPDSRAGKETSDTKSNENRSVNQTLSNKPPDIVDFSGEGTYEISPSAESWTFYGPTRQITLTGRQKIIGAASAVFGTTSGTSRVAVSLCYRRTGETSIVSFVGDNHLAADVDSLQRTFSVTGSAQLPAGVYSVGFCVVNRGRQVIGNNNYVNGWVMVVN